MKILKTLFLVLFFTGSIQISKAQIVEDFYVYPNPVASQLTVGIETNTFSRLSLDFFDLTGQKVMSAITDSIFWPGSYSLNYNVSHLNNGLYLLTLSTSSGESQTIKMIKNSPLSISKIVVSNQDIYPNPAKNIIYIPDNMEEVRVYDLNGKLHLARVKPNHTLDVSQLQNGLYVIKLIGVSSKTSILKIKK